MWLQRVLLDDSGLPILSAHTSEFNTDSLSLSESHKVQSFIFAAQMMVNGNSSEKKQESLLLPLHVKTY